MRMKPIGGRVVERVLRVVGGERPVVQRVVAAAPDDDRVAVVQAQAHLAVDHPLRGTDVLQQVSLEGAEPEAVVGGLGDLVARRPG